MKSSPSIFPILTTHLLLLAVMSIPTVCFASQGDPPDSASVLEITRFQQAKDETGIFRPTDKIRKVSYIGTGALVTLDLEDGRKISNARIREIGKDHLLIRNEQIAFSAIERITLGTQSQRASSIMWGVIVFVIGIACTLILIGLAYWSSAFLLFLLAWIPGGFWVNALFRKFPRFKVNNGNFSLKAVPTSNLPGRIRTRLSGRFRFYHNRTRKY